MDDLTQLALAAREGNRLCLGAFIRQTQADVWQVCNHLGPHGQAEDLTQDVYLKVMRALPTYRGESSARTWLLSIARHTAIDALRAQKRRDRFTNLLNPAAASEPNHSFDTAEMIAALDLDQRAAFVMTQLLGLTYDEAAQACDCAVGTIRSRVARARETLVAALSEAPGQEGRP